MDYASIDPPQYISGNTLISAFGYQKFYEASGVSVPITDRWLTKDEVNSYIDSLTLTSTGSAKSGNMFIARQDLQEQALTYNTFSGFNKPVCLLYYFDGTTYKIYVGDSDNGKSNSSSGQSNIYWFSLDDSVITAGVDSTTPPTLNMVGYLSGGESSVYLRDYSYVYKADETYNRLYSTGYDITNLTNANAGGLRIFDAATETLVTVPFTNGSNIAYGRLSIAVLDNQILIPTYNGHTTTVYSVQRQSSLSGLTATVVNFTNRSESTVPIVNKGASIIQVGSELWAVGSQDDGGDIDYGYIGIYPSTPTAETYTLISTIDITSYTSIPSSGYGYHNYNRSLYYDSDNNRVYMMDLGNNTLVCFNSLNGDLIGYYTFTNTDFGITSGTNYFTAGIIIDELSQGLILTGRMSSTVSLEGTEKSFVICKDCTGAGSPTSNIITMTTFDEEFNQRIKVNSTRYLYGAVPGLAALGTADTTGVVLRYGKII